MKPRIVFLVLSAVAKASTVDQLARSLAPHCVLVHHDFSQTPNFKLTAPNAVFVPEPKRTGWAFFGLVDAIFHSMQYAQDHLEFDYFQLLTPSCLPIKPMEAFEAHVGGTEDAHFGCVDLFEDRDVLMSVGYRALTPESSFRHRVFRRLSKEYFGRSPGRREEAGIWLRSGGPKTPLAWAALAATKALAQPLLGRHIFGNRLKPYYGSTWFGAKRHIVARMLEGYAQPGFREYFSHLRIADEFLIPTLLMSLRPVKGEFNHLIHTFDEAHPGVLQEADLAELERSRAFFARKFPDDVGNPIRARVLHDFAGIHNREVLDARPETRADVPSRARASSATSATSATSARRQDTPPAPESDSGHWPLSVS
jgi:hypothetical protein